MSALQQAAEEINRDPNAAQKFLALISPAAWRWFAAHGRDRVVKTKLGPFNVTILVKDLRPLFVVVFGEPVQFLGGELG